MSAADLLLLARQRSGLSQTEVARRAGTSQPVISAYERARRDPTVSTLRRLVAATGNELELRLASPSSSVPPPASLEEHAERLVDVLELTDAIPPREREPLAMPRIHSL